MEVFSVTIFGKFIKKEKKNPMLKPPLLVTEVLTNFHYNSKLLVVKGSNRDFINGAHKLLKHTTYFRCLDTYFRY
jgi:hypothetical protein